MKKHTFIITLMAMVLFLATEGHAQKMSPEDDIVFIHHSCGNNFLEQGLRSTLEGKSFINEVNDIYYGDALSPDSGRPESLGSVPGDSTNMNHWILWFNDYLKGVEKFDCADGRNAIIMFKSCYPISNISSEGKMPGDPFSSSQTTANYKSVFRKYEDPAGTYSKNGYDYKPLEQIFAEHPGILFIAVTAPPRHFGPSDGTNNAEAQRARDYNNWLKNEWLSGYNKANPGFNNVVVFDWFDVLAYPSDHPGHPNRLRAENGGESGDSHPSQTANRDSANVFSSFIEKSYAQWNKAKALKSN